MLNEWRELLLPSYMFNLIPFYNLFFVQLSSAMLFYWSTSGWVGCLLLHIHFFHNSNCRDCYILRGADLFFQISFTINYRHKTPTLCVVAKSGLLHKFNKSWSLFLLHFAHQQIQIVILVCIFE